MSPLECNTPRFARSRLASRFRRKSLFQIRAALQNQCVAVENEIQQVMSICTAVADENERLKDMLHKNS